MSEEKTGADNDNHETKISPRRRLVRNSRVNGAVGGAGAFLTLVLAFKTDISKFIDNSRQISILEEKVQALEVTIQDLRKGNINAYGLYADCQQLLMKCGAPK